MVEMWLDVQKNIILPSKNFSNLVYSGLIFTYKWMRLWYKYVLFKNYIYMDDGKALRVLQIMSGFSIALFTLCIGTVTHLLSNPEIITFLSNV